MQESESKKPVQSSDALDGKRWLELQPGSKLSIRHAQSARELAVVGPALVLPCVGGEEQFLLARGELETSHGLGARPGAEVVIATPVGNVRYSDAALRVLVATGRLEVASRTGIAHVDPAPGTPKKQVATLKPRTKTVLRGSPKPPELVEACELEAKRAAALAEQVLSAGDGGQSLGERTAAHVEARGRARGVCMTASAAAALAEEADRGRLRDRVAAAERLWKAIPTPKPTTKP